MPNPNPKPELPPELPFEERYRWEPTMGRTGRYRDLQTGRIVAQTTVRADIDRFIAERNKVIDSLSQDLIDGKMSIADWQRAVRVEIKDMHRATVSVARGGYRQMSQSDWGWVGVALMAQYRYLDNFAADIANGRQPLDGRLMTRARMYGEAARGSHEEMVRRMSGLIGLNEERRVLGIADHCPGCLEQADLDWQPYGTLPPIGSQDCLTHCKCHFEYR